MTLLHSMLTPNNSVVAVHVGPVHPLLHAVSSVSTGQETVRGLQT